MEHVFRQGEDDAGHAVDVIPVLIHSGLPDGYLDLFNQAWLNYSGVSTAEVQGWAWTTLIHPEDLEGIVTKWRAALASGDPLLHEARVRRADGQYRWFSIGNVPVRDEGGRIVRWYGAGHDIEDRKQREDRLQLLVDCTPVHLQSARPDGSLDFFNKRWLEYLGLSLEDVFGWDWRKVIHPEDVAGLVEKWNFSVATGQPFEAEARVRGADGKYRWYLHREVPLRDQEGKIVRWFGSSIDIEDSKSAQDALRKSEQQFQVVLDTIPGLVWSAGTDGAVDYLNQRWQEYTGMPLAEAAGWGWKAAIHAEDIDALIDYWKSLLASGTPGEAVVRMRRADGAYRSFLLRAVPLYDGTRKVVKWYGQSTDIHDRKRAEDDLQQALNEIKKLKDQLYKENLALRDEVERASMFDEIVGTSKPLKGVLSRISKVAPTDSTVLITGETGTGKELIARAIHKKSQRSSRTFISVNCAAIPRDLIPSELFGHEKGAFTGATQRRLGRFELADGGSIFLDEVGELLPDTQVALLRVLQERELERVGGGQPIHVDVRVIAATNRDLEAAVANGSFRQDLFYRLNVFPIEVPPLRERKDDLLLLVEYFVQRYATKAGKDIRSIEKKTLDVLQSYEWPGNIRELQNVIERSVILSSGDIFSVDELWLSKEIFPPASRVKASPIAKAQVEPGGEREIIEAALAATRGRVSGPSGAAAKLRIPPSTLETRIKALKINKSQFKFR